MSGLVVYQWGWRPHWLFWLTSSWIARIAKPAPSLSGLVFREGDSEGYAATLLITLHGWGFCLYAVRRDDGGYLVVDGQPVQGLVVGNFRFVPV